MKTNFSRVMATMALRFRDNLALVNVERDRRYSFAEYHHLTNRIAHMMRHALGLGAGDKVMLILENDNLSLLHFPAIYKQEATFVFSNLRDSQEEQARQIDHVRPKFVFIETRLVAEYRDMLAGRGCTVVAMDRSPDLPHDVACFWDLVEAASDADNDCELDVNEHTAILRFTGGTTALGKCAMYSIGHFLAMRDSFYLTTDLGYDEDTKYLAFTPMSHMSLMPFVATFFGGGATYTLNTPDLARWCETVQRERITQSAMVPTLLYRLLDMNSSRTYDLSSLRTMIYGAAPIAPAAVERLVAEFGQIFVQLYGGSETIMFVSALRKREHRSDTEAARARLASAGRVSAGVELMIADLDGNRLPPGQTGEIWLRTQATIAGYYGNPEATAAEFENGYWKSGDVGYVDNDGYLYIVDRKKDMIITGGFNVYAIEVEGALAEHPAVLMSAVVGVPHPDWGEAVHAEVILRDGATATDEDLITHAKQRLGSYKAPKTVTFVAELPLSPVGKVLRRQVRQRYWAGRDRQV
jgi:acyl-CoA synthetase (AMP-forming)/AMP-acid ligase II